MFESLKERRFICKLHKNWCFSKLSNQRISLEEGTGDNFIIDVMVSPARDDQIDPSAFFMALFIDYHVIGKWSDHWYEQLHWNGFSYKMI